MGACHMHEIRWRHRGGSLFAATFKIYFKWHLNLLKHSVKRGCTILCMQGISDPITYTLSRALTASSTSAFCDRMTFGLTYRHYLSKVIVCVV